MKLFNDKGMEFKATETKPPKFSDYGGRTWEVEDRYIDEQKVDFYYEVVYGQNFYFYWDGRWYRLPIFGNVFDSTA